MHQRIGKREITIALPHLTAIILVGFLFTVYAFLLVRNEPGDSAIIYPVVQNTAHGAFMRWNPGAELATGASSPFYVLFLVPFYWLSPSPEFFVFLVKAVNYGLLIGLIGLVWGFLAWVYKGGGWGVALSILLLGIQLPLVKSAIGGFEVGLYFCVLVGSVWATFFAAETITQRASFDLRLLVAAILLSLVPLIRIEGMVFVLPLVAMVFIALRRCHLRHWQLWSVVFALIVFLPVVTWSAYAWSQTGYFLPTSGIVRRNQLLQSAFKQGLPFMSLKWVINYLPYLLLISIGAGTSILLHRNKPTRWWLGVMGITALIVWLPYFTYIFPVDLGWYIRAERHLLIVPFVSTFFLPGVLHWIGNLKRHISVPVVLALVCSLIPSMQYIGPSITKSLHNAWHVYRDPLPYMFMMQPELSDWVNKNTPQSASVLQFEIETHYLMQRRMIDMEGYMGGLALPYVRIEGGGDFAGFLRRYRPDYWVVDRSIVSMEIFHSTIYERAMKTCLLEADSLIMGPIGCTYQESGIRFILVKLPPPGQVKDGSLWEYRGVMKLEYEDAGG